MAQIPFKDFISTWGNGKDKALKVKTESFPEYRILSTDTMPQAKTDEKGAILIIMDTGEVKMNHGGTWGDF